MASSAEPLVAGQADPNTALGRMPTYLAGIVQTTPGTVVIYDGHDATGVPVLASSAVGISALNSAVACHTGVFVALTGGATGSLLLEG